MKLIFKSIKSFFINFFSYCKNIFIYIIKFFKTIFLSNRKRIFGLLMMCLSTVFVSSTAIIFCEFLPNNKSVTLSEIAQYYENEAGEDPSGIIYPYQIVTRSQQTTYIVPQWSKKIRDIYYDDICFDFYQSNWKNLYTPAVVNYVDTSDVHLSVLCMPRDNYVSNSWLYNMPLLYPSSLSTTPTANEIYINEEYANYLISTSSDYNSYEDIVNSAYPECIPYEWGYVSGDNIIKKTVNNYYVIKGVLDSESDEYKYYQNIFGDFFISNESLSLPILNQTYFNVNTDDSKTIKKLNVILNTYDYEANKEYFNSLSSAMTFEYRISFCGEYSSDYSISNIDNTPSKINEKTDNLFDIYSNKTYILYLITYGIFNLISLILLFFSESLFNNKNENSSYNSTIFILTKTGIISIIIGIFSIIGIYLSILLCSTVPTLNILSYLNYYGFILGAIELIIVLITSLFKRKKIISKI